MKNPLRGTITADFIGELIMEEDIVNPSDTLIYTSNGAISTSNGAKSSASSYDCSSTAA